jgi:hypothetical protein
MVHEHGFIPKWIRTSAKTGNGVSDAMNLLIRYIMAMDTWNNPMMDPDGSFEDFDPYSPVFSRNNTRIIEALEAEDVTNDVIRIGSIKAAKKSVCLC